MAMHKQNWAATGLVVMIIAAATSALFIITFSVAVVKAQDECKTILAEAEKNYQERRFDDVIDLLSRCLPSGFTEGEKPQAYRLLSLAYLAKDYRNPAREAIKKLLELAPNYAPDLAQDPEPFINLVNELRKQQPQEQPGEKPPAQVPPAKKGGSKKKWLWIGLGTVALGGGAAAILGGGGKKDSSVPPIEKLADPPGAPSGN